MLPNFRARLCRSGIEESGAPHLRTAKGWRWGSIGFSAVGSGYYRSLGKKGDARLAPSQVGVFRRECAMRILKPFTSNTRLITLCARCHRSEFLQ
jgi:hypothetical protein